jgi:hypothetical protein
VYTGRRARHDISGSASEHRHQPIAAALDRARREHRRDRAGEPGEQRHERAPVEPDPVHHAIDHERDPREVARVLEHRHEERQHRDLRDEHETSASIAATSGSDHEKSAWKSAPITRTNTSAPRTGCVRIASIRSVALLPRAPRRTWARAAASIRA